MVATEFDALQTKLVDQWHSIGRTLADHPDEVHTVVVVPSLSLEIDFPTYALQAYEERMLFLLFLLRKPGIRVVFVTSRPIHPAIVDYYVDMLPPDARRTARERLHLVSPEDGSPEPLSQKLLARPRLIRAIRELVPDPDQAHVIPFNTTELERRLAVELGLPMYAADPRFFGFGTKSGGRRVFAEEGVAHPLGIEDVRSRDDLVSAILDMRSARPSMERVVVKLDEGVSGLGNVTLDLGGLPLPGSDDERASVETLIGRLDDVQAVDGVGYVESLAAHGGVVEEYISGSDYRSPSVQLRLTPLGEVELLSTHDQLLGGPDGQNYLGAVFPADPAYCGLIVEDALAIGRRFAAEGILGRFAIDFVVVRNGDEWTSHAIEINLRKGGTTPPFLILQYLTDGTFDVGTGRFTTPSGDEKHYIATDHLESPGYRRFRVVDLIDVVRRRGLQWSPESQTGTVLHLLTGVGEMGRVGVTVIDDSADLARARYETLVSVFDEEAAQLAT